jgi:hypothetical protein
MAERMVGGDDRHDRIEFAQFWIRFRLVSLVGGVLMLALSWVSGFVSDRPGVQLLFVSLATPALMVAGWYCYRFQRRRSGSAGERTRLPWEQ